VVITSAVASARAAYTVPFVYFIYTVVTAALVVVAAPFLLWKGRGTGKYVRTFRERMNGPVLSAEGGSIWVHAVSVGEVLAARPLIERLKERFPGLPLFVSTTTVTGNAVARKAAARADGLFFAPFDWPRPVRRTLTRLKPRLLVLVETEIWPNLIHEARRRGIRVAVVNGRISPRSFRRYMWVRRLLTHVLHEVDLFLMQSDAHSDRVRRIGAPGERVRTVGNLKYDALSRAGAPESLARLVAPDAAPLWVAGSTAEGEEVGILEAFRALRGRFPEARLLIAPRHPERFETVLTLVQASGWRVARRSTLTAPWTGDVLVLDTLGELAPVYSLATIVFVGGSLVPLGGHNVLEAAIHGKAVIVGPHMENFQEIADLFTSAGALVQVPSATALAAAVLDLMTDEPRRRRIGEAARGLIDGHRGALDRTIEALSALVA
jgi:3-deoxy-D-manno-octulosonic-acid transferase